MRVAKINKYDTANWDGVNTSIFFAGCRHHCPGCFNKELWDFDNGLIFDDELEEALMTFVSDDHVQGLCILGGEPFQQDMSILYRIVYKVNKVYHKPIHIWSGYTFEELANIPGAFDVLQLCDTLVDGRFDIEKKDLTLKHRGSSNQRVINLKEVLYRG